MLTPKQKQLLDFLGREIEAKGICPTYDQMRSAAGLQSKSGINRILGALEERGFIRRIRKRRQAIEVIRKAGEPSRADAAFVAAARDYLTPGEFAFIEAMARSSSGIAADIAQIADARHDHGQRLEVL